MSYISSTSATRADLCGRTLLSMKTKSRPIASRTDEHILQDLGTIPFSRDRSFFKDMQRYDNCSYHDSRTTTTVTSWIFCRRQRVSHSLQISWYPESIPALNRDLSENTAAVDTTHLVLYTTVIWNDDVQEIMAHTELVSDHITRHYSVAVK